MTRRTILFNPNYEYLREPLEHIADMMENKGFIIQDGRNLIKAFDMGNGVHINVKRYHEPHGANALVYSLGLRRPKGYRAYTHAQRILSLGFDTPDPIAYIEERGSCGMLGYTYFVSLQCPYGHKMYEWGDALEGTYESFAAAFGEYSARLHEAGIYHRDYTPGNILWERDDDGTFHFSLIDINQMDFGPVSVSKGALALRKFWGPKRFISLIVEAYAKQRGADTDAVVRQVMLAREKFWRRYQRRKPEKVVFNLEY